MKVELKNANEGISAVKEAMIYFNYNKNFCSSIDILINDEVYSSTITFIPSEEEEEIISVMTKIELDYLHRDLYFAPFFSEGEQFNIGNINYYVTLDKKTKVDESTDSIKITFIEY